MKIALVTDDGKTINAHFGRAQYYLVVEILDGKEVSRDLREKLGHQHFHGGEPENNHSNAQHGFDPASRNRHSQMLKTIADCDLVIGGGMGKGAVAGIKESGKEICLVETRYIKKVLEKFI